MANAVSVIISSGQYPLCSVLPVHGARKLFSCASFRQQFPYNGFRNQFGYYRHKQFGRSGIAPNPLPRARAAAFLRCNTLCSLHPNAGKRHSSIPRREGRRYRQPFLPPCGMQNNIFRFSFTLFSLHSTICAVRLPYSNGGSTACCPSFPYSNGVTLKI